uniref:Structural maintenance of chromosomes protein n=1 Tax=Syphacia muris TaxID=451379 RepID=A0A0N5AQ25_9BILA
MRVRKIEIDGFKSYAQKQVVDNFDPQFNAITGLNGSGKSNILDAICFVLGITNLSQVRASQLVDLVYKQGQAGVTKATVTITFDNSDREKSPVGYEKYNEIIVRRQIIVNGRNTYTINGTAATNSRVADMFRSVGLNVNNPHFLIMQGRITKVLNMKPAEILAMIEEAAGTRMFEAKKQAAIKTIEKKQWKVEEIKQLLRDDILPGVEKLKKDRNNYLEYQKIGRDIEILERRLIAFDFYNSLSRLEKLSSDIMEIKNRQVELEKLISAAQEDLTQKEQLLANLEEDRKNKDSEEKKQIEDNVKKLSAKMIDAEGRRDAVKEKMKDQSKAVERKQKSIASDKKVLEKKSAELEKLENENGSDEQMGEEAEKAVDDARKKLEAIAKGLTTDESGNAVSLNTQLSVQRTAFSELETTVKKSSMRLKHLESCLPQKRKELASLKSNNSKEEEERKNLQIEVADLKRQLEAIGYNKEAEAELVKQQKSLFAERQQLSNEIEVFESKNQHLRFSYSKPHSNFNCGSVRGLVAKLFTVKDMQYATALEVAAGSCLSYVIVDSARTAKELLEHGQLNRRVTMVPLDKVQGREIDRRKLQRAVALVGKGNVMLAKDLLGYDNELEPVMNYIFGNVLITTSDDYAKQVTFDPQILTRSVSIDGSDFNPAGVLSGGSRGNRTAVLIEIKKVVESTSKIAEIDAQLAVVNDELANFSVLRKNSEELEALYQKRCGMYKAVCHALQYSPMQLLTDEITEMEKELAELQNTISSSTQEMGHMKEKINELEQKKKNEKAFRDREKKLAQKELQEAEKKLAHLKNTFENVKTALLTIREETNSLTKNIEDDEKDLKSMTETLVEYEANFNALEEEVKQTKVEAEKEQQKLQVFLKEMRKQDTEIRKVVETVNSINKQIKEYELNCYSSKKDAEDIEKNKEELEKRVSSFRSHLEHRYKWITDEKRHFGKPGSMYDFTEYSMDSGVKALDEKKKRKEFLENTINAKAMHMLGQAEEQCRQIELKRQQLEKDKEKLFNVISILDEKKRKEILRAHQQVNKDFGNIFSTLLPGTDAKLEPPYGAESALEGLEVKVAFRGKWKESLGELSGGQRSLVALSLVLAMLKFNPAPLYILDEVDAALDLSHTQNIGAMIKAHFKESQFIVVSLKDGMFNHANVLFKTRFADGTSMVTRTENRSSCTNRGLDGKENLNDVEESGAKRRKPSAC